MRFRPWLPVLAACLASAGSVTGAPLEATVSPRLREAFEADPDGTRPVWVYLADKGPGASERLGEAEALLWPRARSRRALRGAIPGATIADLPVFPDYLLAVAARVDRIRHTSRWLNAVSVEATAAQASSLVQLPFVTRLTPVERYARRPAADQPRSATRYPPAPSDPPAVPRTDPPDAEAESSIDYGLSLDQVAQINVPAVHDLGLQGQDVVIAVFDTGFDNLVHEAFSAADIVAAYDFVNGDPDVASGPDRGDGDHGTRVLSVLGGYKTGELVGPAFAASFVLAKTEDTGSETPVEEDNWAAAAEWAEALGAEIITTSLGYTFFDSGAGYGPENLDGRTAVTTLAAQRATELGVVVLASAGNGGEDPADPGRNTLVAPADGASVLAVGGVDALGERVGFSSVGPTADGRIKPDVMARAVGVRTAGTAGVDAYTLSAGTSFSCPLAAGVAALVLQAHPDYSPAQVALALRSTASRSDAPDNRFGWGILDALAAIRADVASEP